jgi:hypothetical protein
VVDGPAPYTLEWLLRIPARRPSGTPPIIHVRTSEPASEPRTDVGGPGKPMSHRRTAAHR